MLETEPTGIPVQLDGEYFWTPRPYQSVVGHRHVLRAQASYEIAGRKYAFAHWENGSTRRSRSFVAPAPGPGPGLDLLRMKAIYLPTLQ